jgi:hypothetical protein
MRPGKIPPLVDGGPVGRKLLVLLNQRGRTKMLKEEYVFAGTAATVAPVLGLRWRTRLGRFLSDAAWAQWGYFAQGLR